MILTKVNRKTINLDALRDEKIKQNRIDELLIVVPTNRKLRSLKKEIISYAPQKTVSTMHIETIRTIALRLAGREGHDEEPVNEATASVLLQQCFQEVQLQYFNIYKNNVPLGTLQKLRNVIAEYKTHGILPDKLRDEAKTLTGAERKKAFDIAALYEQYTHKFKKYKVKEIGDVYIDLISVMVPEFQQQFRKLYPNVNIIIINGFAEFTAPEIEIINMISNIPDQELYLNFDHYEYNKSLFSHLDRCYKRLRTHGFVAIEDTSPAEEDYFRSKIKRSLFKTSSGSPDTKFKNQINKIRARDRVQEISFIAKRIKELIHKENAEPSSICIAINLITDYSPIIRDIFSTYGIPYNLTDRFTLNTFQAIIAIVNLLEVLENDYYYKNIFRAFSGEYTRSHDISLLDLVRTSSELKIFSGMKNWKNGINIALSEEKDDEYGRYRLQEKQAMYRRSLKALDRIDKELTPFKQPLTLQEFLDRLKELIFGLDIPSKILKLSKGNEEQNVKALAAFWDTVDEFFTVLELEYGNEEHLPLSFYLQQLRTLVANTRFNVKELPNYGVQITTLNEIRGLHFDYLFIAGMNDGTLPTKYTPEVFFSGQYQKKEMQHVYEERYLFYQALCTWKKELCFSWVLAEGEEEKTRSNFLDAFESLFEVTEYDVSKLSQTLVSTEEILIELGKTNNFDMYAHYIDDIIGSEQLQELLKYDSVRITGGELMNPFAGYVDSSVSTEIKKALLGLAKRRYSISQLETYAKCPFKFFAERLLRLESIEEPVEELEAMEVGTLLHRILFEFYSEITEKKIVIPGCNDATFTQLQNRLFEIADARIAELPVEMPLSFFEIEKIRGINGNPTQSILYKFLEYERNNEEGFIAQLFEQEFGKIPTKDETQTEAVEFAIDGTELRGVIDRIDVQEEKGWFKVIDYKSGAATPKKEDLINGLSLQLPIYMLAAQQFLEEKTGIKYDPAYPEIYRLRFDDEKFGSAPIATHRKKIDYKKFDDEKIEEMINHNEALMENAKAFITDYVEDITQGKFHLSELEDREKNVCKYCDYMSVCRVKERRT